MPFARLRVEGRVWWVEAAVVTAGLADGMEAVFPGAGVGAFAVERDGVVTLVEQGAVVDVGYGAHAVGASMRGCFDVVGAAQKVVVLIADIETGDVEVVIVVCDCSAFVDIIGDRDDAVGVGVRGCVNAWSEARKVLVLVIEVKTGNVDVIIVVCD